MNLATGFNPCNLRHRGIWEAADEAVWKKYIKNTGRNGDAKKVAYSHQTLKVHKHEMFLNTFFAETETIWSQGPVTRDF
jgi:hypothetical protein